MSSAVPNIILSDKDYEKLSALVAACRADSVAFLEEELGRAMVVPDGEVPDDVVTMNSVVRVRDLDSGAEHEYQLVFPHEASLSENRISILASLGVALIGLRAGSRYEWHAPNKRVKQFQVLSIHARAPSKVAAR